MGATEQERGQCPVLHAKTALCEDKRVGKKFRTQLSVAILLWHPFFIVLIYKTKKANVQEKQGPPKSGEPCSFSD
jgi:hypothetical protein